MTARLYKFSQITNSHISFPCPVQPFNSKCTEELLSLCERTALYTGIEKKSLLAGLPQSLVGKLHYHHHHLSLNREGRWGTTGDFATKFPPFSPVLHCPLGLGELQACPFPDVVLPPLPTSALSSSPFHCALQDGFGHT